MAEQNHKIITALFIQKQHIGVCVFSEQTLRIQSSQIYNICCINMPQLIRLLQQSTTILANQMKQEIFRELSQPLQKIQLVDQKYFQHEIIQHNLLRISAHKKQLVNPRHYFKLMSQFQYKFKALGIMLNYLLNSGSDHSKIYLEDIQYYTDTLFQHLNISAGTKQYLQITRQDDHPSQINIKGTNKQGFSLLSAYESYLHTPGSKKILRQIFMNPTYNQQILVQRQNCLKWMKNNMNDSHKYLKFFRNIYGIQAILKRFGNLQVDQDQWKKMIKSIIKMLQFKQLINFPREDLPQKIISYIEDQAWNILAEIQNVLIQTLQLNPLGIRPGVDRSLDHLKHTYDTLPHILNLISRQQQWDINFQIVFITQVGYLVRIPVEMQLPQDLDQQQWTLQFVNSTGKFYSTSLTQHLDEDYGDLYGQISDTQKRILMNCETMLIQNQSSIIKLYWKTCQIECLWGASQIGNNMCCPRLSSQSLIVSNGWHMLLNGSVIQNHSFSFPQSQAPRSQVINSQKNIVNTSYSNRCCILTGANGSGKTVYLKQMAINIFLAHIGFFVPASLAEIPLVDGIVLVQKKDSIYLQQEYGYEAQMNSLSKLFQPNYLTRKTLVLLDQIGTQIDYANSLKLLCAINKHLTQSSFSKNRILFRQSDQFQCPITLIVTHLSAILLNNMIEQNYLIRFFTMVTEQNLKLFKIKPGVTRGNYGIDAASQIFPEGFIELSRHYHEMIYQ